mgnify:FL=1
MEWGLIFVLYSAMQICESLSPSGWKTYLFQLSPIAEAVIFLPCKIGNGVSFRLNKYSHLSRARDQTQEIGRQPIVLSIGNTGTTVFK